MREMSGKGGFNWLLLFTLLVVFTLGLVNLASAAHGASSNLALIQGLWFAGCLLIALGVSFFDYHVFERLAYPIFVVTLLMLFVVLGLGKVINNVRRWIDLGLFNFQPSEVMKIAVILALAKYFSQDETAPQTRSYLRKILLSAHLVYPLGVVALLLSFWSKEEVLALGAWRYVILFGCVIWEGIAIYNMVFRPPTPYDLQQRPDPNKDKSYSLDDLIKPGTPLYPVGATLALLLFWENDFLSGLGNWRFLLLLICLAWTAASIFIAFYSGRSSLHDWLSPVILAVLPAMLIMGQPDLGTAMVILITAATMILFMKVKWSSFVIASVVLAIGAVAAWFFVLKPYQQDRIKAFIAPTADIKDSGYHARQSIIAVGSGQLSGKGWGKSTQTQFHFLPEQHTDFVFSVWAEEQGFTGCFVVLLLFLFMLLLIVNVASNARDRFGVLVSIGLAALVFWHVFINIGMVIGVLPVVGLTLPLWSYGGSSILAFMIGFGLVFGISRRQNVY